MYLRTYISRQFVNHAFKVSDNRNVSLLRFLSNASPSTKEDLQLAQARPTADTSLKSEADQTSVSSFRQKKPLTNAPFAKNLFLGEFDKVTISMMLIYWKLTVYYTYVILNQYTSVVLKHSDDIRV